MKPDSSKHNPNPQRLRSLIEAAGMSQREAADSIGVSIRALRYYLLPEDNPKHHTAPYPVQYAIEGLALGGFALSVLEECAHPRTLAMHLRRCLAIPELAEPAQLMIDEFIDRRGRIGAELAELLREEKDSHGN